MLALGMTLSESERQYEELTEPFITRLARTEYLKRGELLIDEKQGLIAGTYHAILALLISKAFELDPNFQRDFWLYYKVFIGARKLLLFFMASFFVFAQKEQYGIAGQIVRNLSEWSKTRFRDFENDVTLYERLFLFLNSIISEQYKSLKIALHEEGLSDSGSDRKRELVAKLLAIKAGRSKGASEAEALPEERAIRRQLLAEKEQLVKEIKKLYVVLNLKSKLLLVNKR